MVTSSLRLLWSDSVGCYRILPGRPLIKWNWFPLTLNRYSLIVNIFFTNRWLRNRHNYFVARQPLSLRCTWSTTRSSGFATPWICVYFEVIKFFRIFSVLDLSFRCNTAWLCRAKQRHSIIWFLVPGSFFDKYLHHRVTKDTEKYNIIYP